MDYGECFLSCFLVEEESTFPWYLSCSLGTPPFLSVGINYSNHDAGKFSALIPSISQQMHSLTSLVSSTQPTRKPQQVWMTQSL